MTRVNEVLRLFSNGHNCAQSLLAIYGRDLGLDYSTAVGIASTFGGGIVDSGATCGAVTGALMLIGLKHGAGDVKDRAKNANTSQLAQIFIKEFEDRHSTTMCSGLLGYKISENNSPEQDKIICERCPKFVKDAAEILEQLLRGEYVKNES
jgi:C_GCAxxG_C_C family probable redox protein